MKEIKKKDRILSHFVCRLFEFSFLKKIYRPYANKCLSIFVLDGRCIM